MDQCRLSFNGVQCTNEASSWWSYGCIHEHTEVGIGVCETHKVVHMIDGLPWSCIPCREGSEPHVCEAKPIQVVNNRLSLPFRDHGFTWNCGRSALQCVHH